MTRTAAHATRLLLALLALPCLAPRPAHAADSIEIPALLAERGTRLLVVEFYATWCQPCMAAMPRWKAIKEKYAAQGLRIAVVNSQDPDGGCKALPFSPDASYCDLEGHIANAMGVGGKLPAAFLWSWQGNLLVQRGHVDAVEAQIERYLQTAPRVLVQKGNGATDAAMLAVREALTRDGKVLVVASADEQRLIDKAKQAAGNARYDEKSQCQLGAELPPNALLRVSRVGEGKAAFLNVQMQNLETGCTLQSGSAPWAGEVAPAADEAVAKLMRKLRRDRVQMPGGGDSGPVEPVKASGPHASGGAVEDGKASGPAVEGGEVAAAVGRLIVVVQPKEAVVEVTGPRGYRATGRGGWESSTLKGGTYAVEATAAGHETARQSVVVAVDDVRTARLVLEKLGGLEVAGSPAGAKVEIRGPAGFSTTLGLPVKVENASKGEYAVEVRKAGFETERYTAVVRNGERAVVAAKLLPLGSVVVEGAPVGALVEVRGPSGFAVSKGLPMRVEGAVRGRYEVKVSREGYVAVDRAVEVKAGQVARVEVKLEREAVVEAEPGPDDGAAEEQARREREALAARRLVAPPATVVAKTPGSSGGRGTGLLVAGSVVAGLALGVAGWTAYTYSDLQTKLGQLDSGGKIVGISGDDAVGTVSALKVRSYVAAGLGAVGAGLLIAGIVKRSGADAAVQVWPTGNGAVVAWQF